ncbi:MAG: VOC family protein [Acetivibrionales bacterium]
MGMIKKRKMQHIGIACTDVEKAAKWYQEHLGFEVVGCFPVVKHNCYFLKNGTAVYELYQVDDMDPAVQGKVDHIAYESNDIEAGLQVLHRCRL